MVTWLPGFTHRVTIDRTGTPGWSTKDCMTRWTGLPVTRVTSFQKFSPVAFE